MNLIIGKTTKIKNRDKAIHSLLLEEARKKKEKDPPKPN
jgi:hypothetical protein